MINSSGLIVFESADEILIEITNFRPTLSAAGLYCELDSHFNGIRVCAEEETEVRDGFEHPLVYVRSGDSEHGRKQVWFTNRAAADALVSKVSAVYREKYKEHQPFRAASFPKKAVEWVGVVLTAICVSFVGAGAANFGWKTFDPLASKFADSHQSDDYEKAKIQAMQLDQTFRTAQINQMIEEQQSEKVASAFKRALEKYDALDRFQADVEGIWQKMDARDKAINQMIPETNVEGIRQKMVARDKVINQMLPEKDQ